MFVPELECWVITCTSYGPAGPAVFLATTEDFLTVERHGIIRQPEDKNAALLPHRIDGKWVLFHRPKTEFGGSKGEILLSRSDDLVELERTGASPAPARRRLVGREPNRYRPAAARDRARMAPDLPRRQGDGRGSIYRVGLALLDLDEPTRVLHRLPEWILGAGRSV